MVISTTGKISKGEVYEQSDKIKRKSCTGFSDGRRNGTCVYDCVWNCQRGRRKKGILSGWRWRRTDAHGQSGIYRKAESNNLVHICLNNEAHESVGGMPTGCVGLSYAKVAETVGYEFVYCVDTIEELKQVLNEIKGKRKLTFIEIKVAMESRADLGRPKETLCRE